MQKNYRLAAGGPRRRGAPCHGTNGTMVNPALLPLEEERKNQ